MARTRPGGRKRRPVRPAIRRTETTAIVHQPQHTHSQHAPIVAPPAPSAIEPESLSFLISHYARLVWANKWMILALVVCASAGTLFYSKRITPIYESTAAIQINRKAPTAVVGKDSNQSGQGDAEQFIATQVRLIQSSSVLRPVAEQFGFLTPEMPSSSSSSLDLKGAVSLPGLKVVQAPGTYIILISYRSESPVKSAEIANAVAKSFIDQNYKGRLSSTNELSQFMVKQIDELRSKMERSSAAVVAYGQNLDLVNPEDKTNIQANRLIQLNADYTAAQLDRLKKEAAFNELKNGTLESAQTSGQGENTRKTADQLREAEEKFDKIKAIYGAKHPEYQKAEAEVAVLKLAQANATTNTLKRVESEYEESVKREQMLKAKVDDLKVQVDSLNMRSTRYQALIREAESDRKLYEELVQKIKEAGINSGFDNNSIEIAAPAQPEYQPVSPNVRNNVLVALMLSLFAGIAGVILIDPLNTTVRDPESLARSMRTEVVGILPFIKDWRGRRHVLGRNEGAESAPFAPFLDPGVDGNTFDGFDEAMRSLRNTILLSAANGPILKLLFTSASPGEGKTTTAVHVAVAHALQGYKTLLIDADLRRPSTQQILNYPAKGGLSSVIREDKDWRNVLSTVASVPNLDILPAGAPVGDAASMLEKIMPFVLSQAEDRYSLIVIDAPPMLGFSEPLRLAVLVDGVVIITRAGQTHKKDVATMLHTLRRLSCRVVGIVLNGVTKDLATRYDYPGTYGGYQKYYKSGKTTK